jgi:alkylation response protein AidB-like acyl-CoA dehydrogenase
MVALDAETVDLFGRTVRAVLSADGDVDADRTASLEEVGWRDILVTDARAVVPLVLGIQGELRARSAVLDDVAFDALRPGSAAWFEEIGTASYVHPRPGAGAAARVADGALLVDGVALRASGDGRSVLVARDAAALRCVVAEDDALARTPIAGLDPSLALARVHGSVRIDDLHVRDDTIADAVEPACRRALAHELLGLTSAMLERAAHYAGEREQFGQPIGTFQAVKHRLADVLVARNAGAVAAGDPWDGDEALGAAVAKCLAGRAFLLAAENCLQVMGAIGFTREHDLHRFILRGTVLDALYGSTRRLRREIGLELGGRAQLPRPGVL